MFELLNTLYVQTPGASLHLDHDAVRIVIDGEIRLRTPLMRLDSIVTFGNVSVSTRLIHRCADDGRSLVFLTTGGRFKARLEGPVRGNVLLRRAQHLALDDLEKTSNVARQFVAGKVQNSRLVLMRGARESKGDKAESLRSSSIELSNVLQNVHELKGLEYIRGAEGDAARIYSQAFNSLIRADEQTFTFERRSRRPPRDRINSLLSFLYSLVRGECHGALEGVGLDPQVGYLHALRPGRPALALDLMEELRPLVADRLAITLINRRQLSADNFEELPGGAVQLTEEGRRITLSAYQERKKREAEHRLLKQKLPIGLVPHVQARLLARHLRGDLPHYPAYVGR